MLGPLEVEVADGVARLVEGNSIAGSTLTLDRAFKRAVTVDGLPIVDAVRALSGTPARLLGLAARVGSIEPGKDADLVVLGPGSWFTSVIPHLLVPGLAAALRATTARRALVLNLADQPGETAGFSAERHLHVLAQHAPEFTVHDIVVDATRVAGEREREQLRRTAGVLDARVQFADVSRPGTPLHDPAKLASALEAVCRPGEMPTVPTTATVPTMAPGEPDGTRPNGPRGDDPWR